MAAVCARTKQSIFIIPTGLFQITMSRVPSPESRGTETMTAFARGTLYHTSHTTSMWSTHNFTIL